MDAQTIPSHVAIIMDGNGRWAKKRGLPRTLGHKEGLKALKRTVKNAYSLGIRYLSVYVFSTENWKRPKDEVSFLLGILDSLLVKEVKELHKNEVRVRFVGDLNALPESTQKKIKWAHEHTDKNKKLQLNLLVNYGGRQEIIHAVKFLAKNPQKAITEENLRACMFDPQTPDPELIIRTGGEKRLSNFLLWQSAYSEFWFTKEFWPDFNKEHLQKALDDYSKRDRRFGGINA
ncbi:MAG: isoprenyl transferase [Candidatus Margulisbacteria bacterium]|nr:isoprenyl transferase [Candidatus Margulisiibacteriota bacterium]